MKPAVLQQTSSHNTKLIFWLSWEKILPIKTHCEDESHRNPFITWSSRSLWLQPTYADHRIFFYQDPELISHLKNKSPSWYVIHIRCQRKVAFIVDVNRMYFHESSVRYSASAQRFHLCGHSCVPWPHGLCPSVRWWDLLVLMLFLDPFHTEPS